LSNSKVDVYLFEMFECTVWDGMKCLFGHKMFCAGTCVNPYRPNGISHSVWHL